MGVKIKQNSRNILTQQNYKKTKNNKLHIPDILKFNSGKSCLTDKLNLFKIIFIIFFFRKKGKIKKNNKDKKKNKSKLKKKGSNEINGLDINCIRIKFYSSKLQVFNKLYSNFFS